MIHVTSQSKLHQLGYKILNQFVYAIQLISNLMLFYRILVLLKFYV